jgi:hypothetical protein
LVLFSSFSMDWRIQGSIGVHADHGARSGWNNDPAAACHRAPADCPVILAAAATCFCRRAV